MIYQGDTETQRRRGRGGRGGCDFRFFEKKLGKKLPCRVVARLNIFNSKNGLGGLQLGKKAFAELFSKSDNASPASPASPRPSHPLTDYNLLIYKKQKPQGIEIPAVFMFSGG